MGLIFRAIFVLTLCCSAFGQSRQPTPQPGTSSPTGTGRSVEPRPNTSESIREVDAAYKELRALEIPWTEESRNSIVQLTRNIYRKPTREEMKVLTPSAEYYNKYAQFLRQPETGIIKLNSNSSCAESPSVVAASENCLQYSMPGGGTAYSFRAESHRTPRLADLTLSKNVLMSDGVLQHGILVNLGDVPLDTVTPETRGIKYLFDFKPLTTAESLVKFDELLQKGIKADGFVYGLGFYVQNQTTYALRSIAYKGKVARSVNGIIYNELDFDKRRDILVAFRVIELETNGNVTLIWKILSNRESPTLKSIK
jgi:hypothetical protein